jgi:ribokinase
VRTIRKEKAKIKPLLPRDTRPCDLVAVGENSVDLLAVVPEWPAPDAKQALDRFLVLPGGQVATAAIAAARLGARTRYLGVVGGDRWADAVRASLTEAGVDATLVIRPEARSRTAVVLVDRAGRRTILADRDARLALGADEIDESWIASGRLLMLDATDPDAALAAAAIASRAGMPVMLDIDQPGPTADALLAAADVVVTSEEFPTAQTGRALLGAALADLDARHRPALLIATRGAGGAVARWQGEEISVQAPRIDVVDTTGAGDAFRGALAACWLAMGESADPGTLLKRAVVAGTLNCRALGAQSALPTMEEIEQWL